ncbi:hypothetical protein GCM10009678_15120 [Actinomadura kijaniata]|uniref:Uncharacterized protein n=1 Tax=Actinomadura namibiensis TaxID=182080 RepID=A0A7W3QN40_ACTNM|nr:hypothetical protein [Actinomadura namibiensis]
MITSQWESVDDPFLTIKPLPPATIGGGAGPAKDSGSVFAPEAALDYRRFPCVPIRLVAECGHRSAGNRHGGCVSAAR